MMIIWLIASLGAMALGMLAVFAAGMSDNPEAGDQAAKQGCALLIGGLVSAIACVAVWVL